MLLFKYFVISIILILSFDLILSRSYYKEFIKWKTHYHKNYLNKREELYRYYVWLENLKFIQQNNYYNYHFYLEMNKFGDMTWKEFQKNRMGLNRNNQLVQVIENSIFNKIDKIPKYINWTEKGVVTPVKDQYDCGSCWAFSTTGAIESFHAIRTGTLISLSEENLIDCTFDYGNMGCLGGLPSNAMNYVIANGGIDTESSYPLSSIFFFQCDIQEMCPCLFNRSSVGAKIHGYGKILSGDERDLEYAIANIGPISVCIDATREFQFYKSGIFISSNCSSTNLNHAMLVVGFGTTELGEEYYIVKNSWGTDWGINGYILMARNNNNMCGIATNAIYPY